MIFLGNILGGIERYAMRIISLFLLIFFVVSFLPTAQAQSRKDAFKKRIESALREKNEQKKQDALVALFFREGLDKKTSGFADRAIKMLANTSRRKVTFAPLPHDAQFLHVLDGYEYRPNLEPIGYVVLTSPKDKPGNNTKIPYGLHPKSGRYAFPSTIRKLVNASAQPDKQLQMIAIGIAHPPLTFQGWCDIALSNGTTKRIELDDQGRGNQTRVMRGQKIEGCELTNITRKGSLSLKLVEDNDTIFDQRIEPPDLTITYKR